MKKLLGVLVFLGSCAQPVPAVEAPHWLIVSIVLADGSYQSMAVRHRSMNECEKDIPKALAMVRKHKETISVYVVVCSRVESTGEAS